MEDQEEGEPEERAEEEEYIDEAEEEEFQDSDVDYVECFFKDNISFVIEVRHDWAPLGAERFMELVDDGYFTNIALFRAVKDFLVQFGLAADDEMRNKWREIPNIKDDPLLDMPFTEGMMSFAGGGKDSRGTQIFITLGKEVPSLGTQLWETPFGKIIFGMERVQKINFEYGDSPPWGKGPDQQKIWTGGYKYLEDNFPNLSYIQSCGRLETDYDDSMPDYSMDNMTYEEYMEAYYQRLDLNEEDVDDAFNDGDDVYGDQQLNQILGKRKLEAYPFPEDEIVNEYTMLGGSLVIPFSICSCLVIILIVLFAWVNKKKSRVE